MLLKESPMNGFQGRMDRWVEQELFEEDVRAVLRMMRPNSRERLLGWQEYRTGNKHLRITISWDDEYGCEGASQAFAVPNLVEVLETLLVGSVKNQDEIDAPEEFALYRTVVKSLYERLREMEASYQ
jgi:hypothetical protein